MPLFTNSPVDVAEDTVAPISSLGSDKTFVFRAQLPNNKSIVAEYIEILRQVTAIHNERLLVKYTDTTKTRRGLLSIASDIEGTTGTLYSSPINLTFSYNKDTSVTALKDQIETMRLLMGLPGFIDGFVSGMVDVGPTI